MPITIEYYAHLASPWTYLGHDRICQLAKKYQAKILFKPFEVGKVFQNTGGLPLAKRAPERQNYRLQELDRWRKELKLDLNSHPKYFPVLQTDAAIMCLAADNEGQDILPFAGALMRAVWAEERDISDHDTLIDIANSAGLNGSKLLDRREDPKLLALYENYTDEAIAKGVFGAPSYVIGEKIFWGQDRLMFVEKILQGDDQ